MEEKKNACTALGRSGKGGWYVGHVERMEEKKNACTALGRSGKGGWYVGHVERMEEKRNACTALIGKREETRPVATSSLVWLAATPIKYCKIHVEITHS